MSREDSIIVGDYEFWDFGQEVDHLLYFMYRRLSYGGKVDDEANIRELIGKIGLWEDYIRIKKIIQQEVHGDEVREIVSGIHGPNVFDINFWDKMRACFCGVQYSESESLRRTFGRSGVSPIIIELFRGWLININKWLLLKKMKGGLLD